MSNPISQQQIGSAKVTRVEEMAGPAFRLTTLFPDWDDAVFEAHKDWLVPTYVNPAKMTALLAMLPPAAVVLGMQQLFVKGLTETEK